MHDHSKPEHDYNRVHRKSNRVRQIEHEENPIIHDVNHERIDRVVHRLSQADKNIVDNSAADICNIKRHELNDNSKNCACVWQVFGILEKRCPQRNRHRPNSDNYGGNKIVVALPQFRIAVLAVPLYDFSQRIYRNQQPAPNKIIRNSIVALFGNHIYHFAYHYGIYKIIDELLHARKNADLAPFF